MRNKLLSALFPLSLIAASCGADAAGDSERPPAAATKDAFAVEVLGTFAQPWAMTLLPDGEVLVTERGGALMLVPRGGAARVILTQKVDYGGQGGLGDVVLAPDFRTARNPAIYLSWVEAGADDTRGAVVGRVSYHAGAKGPLIGEPQVIWRQAPKVSGRGHFSHRLAFSPDGRHLYISSGDRQKFTPAQYLSNNLGKILRLNPDGSPAAGNPFAGKSGSAAEIWSYGHRNVLGLQFDASGRLWALEHGPAGGDELNLIGRGRNYGWPLVSDGDHYDGQKIPRNSTRPDLAQPAISWNPVIAPGNFIFYSGRMWPEWQGQALIAALGTEGLVRVRIDGEQAVEEARYPLGRRIREIRQAPDGALYVLEDGKGGRLLRLSRK